jgi:hypothetical protein
MKNLETCVELFVNIIYRHRSAGLSALRHLVNNLALFFCDLFTVLPHQHVIKLVNTNTIQHTAHGTRHSTAHTPQTLSSCTI